MSRRIRVGLSVVLMQLVLAGAWGDSLFNKQAAVNGTLVSDQKVRFEVGDIITVLVRENVNATTRSSTDTEKETELVASATTDANRFLVGGGAGGLGLIPKELLPNWNINVENEFEAEGTTRRSNQLTLELSCIVKQVFENGNVYIEGTKEVTVNREDTRITVSGIVRARDVTPANTVLSTQLADASVRLKGHGPLWNNQRRGFFTKLLDWVSPF
ncbi:MAG: flagellar basal body L-ring protein FlgH [Candidatus Hydrogenedentes bacterium]|nr:flagellar basal body L-ring protein FlgH [Candidatus Hydrogenedentota bacterium]